MMKTVTVTEDGDEQMLILVDGKEIASANHDEDGRYGMDKLEDLAEALAKALGAKFERS